MSKNKSKTKIGYLAILLAGQCTAVSAQLEEVVVTAQKRSESVQDVPIAINALTGDMLNDFGVVTSDDLTRLYPNLSLKAQSSINTGFAIRGVGTDNFHITAQQAVGSYLDEVSLPSPFTSQFALFDMERVEVLRGPQNTLFGRNTTGGAVNFISRKPDPSEELNGQARVRLGNEGAQDVEFALGVPISDSVAARVAILSVNRDGVYRDLVRDADIGRVERHSGRLQLMWVPSDTTQVLFNVHAGYNRGDRGPRKSLGYWEEGSPNIGGPGGRGSPDCSLINGAGAEKRFGGPNSCVSARNSEVLSPSTGDWNEVRDGANNVADIDFEGAFIKIEHDFESMSLTSITSYDTIAVQFLENFPSNGIIQFYGGQEGDWDIFSQELRLASAQDGSFRWIGGIYYSNEDDSLNTIIRNGADGAPPFTVVPSVAIDQDVEILSLYGQVEVDLSETVTLTTGLRYTQDEKEGVSTVRLIPGTTTGIFGAPVAPADFIHDLALLESATQGAGDCPGSFPCATSIDVTQDLKEWGGKIGLDWRVNDFSLAYVSYSRGFKSGAFDTRALAAFSGTADKPVGPEFLDAYELGFKTTLFDESLEFNTALFYYEWEDLQTFATDSNGAPAFLNVPMTEILGAEAEVKWAPGSGWYIQAGVGILDTEIIDGGGLNSVKEGASVSATPDLTLSGMVRKETEISSGLLSLQTTFNYADEMNSSNFDSPRQRIDSTFFMNARASYVFGSDDQYEIAIWGDNLTEEKACTRIDDNGPFQNGVSCIINPGMAFYGLSAQVNF